MSIQSIVRKPLVAALLGATVALVPVAALVASRNAHSEGTADGATAPRAVAPAPAPATAAAGGLAATDFRALVRRHGPAVVNVSVRPDGRNAAARALPPGADDDNPLFRHFGVPMSPRARPRSVARARDSSSVPTA